MEWHARTQTTLKIEYFQHIIMASDEEGCPYSPHFEDLENAPKNHNKKLTMAAINVHCIEFSDLILNLISDKIEQRNNASVKTRNMNLFVNDLELASR
jgi:hypothetical protein